MSNIRDTDFLLVSRDGSSFKCAKQDIGNVRDTDTFLVNRSGSSYKCAKADVASNVRDTDIVLVNRSGASFQATGADFKALFGARRPDNWVAGQVWTNAQFVDCASGAGVVIAVDGRSSGQTTDIVGSGNSFSALTTSNGIATQRKSAVCYGKDRFVIARYQVSDPTSPLTWISTDAGATWTAGSHPVGIPDPGYGHNRRIGTAGITYDPNLDLFIMMVWAENVNYICKSTDGLSWTAYSNTTIGPNNFIDYVTDKLYSEYFTGSSRLPRYSYNADDWSAMTGLSTVGRMVGGDGFFTAIGNNTPATIYKSTDGIAFNNETTAPTGKNITAAGFGGGWVMGISSTTSDVIASNDGTNWEVIPGVSTAGRTITYSKDLNEWHVFGANGFTMYTA